MTWRTELATLLERVDCLKIKVHFQNIFLFFLWVITCFKVGEYGVDISTQCVSINRHWDVFQIKSILLSIIIFPFLVHY